MRPEFMMLFSMLWMVPSAVFAAWLMDRDKDRLHKEWGSASKRQEGVDTLEVLAIIFAGLFGPVAAASFYACHVAWFRTWKV